MMTDTPTAKFRITVTDLQDRTSETVEIPAGEYVVVTANPCYIAHCQEFSGGKTVQLTIKDRMPATAHQGAMSE